MAKYAGRTWLLTMDGDRLLFATDSQFEVNADVIDVTNKDSNQWAENIAGNRNWSMNSDGFLDLAATGFGVEAMFDAIDTNAEVTVVFKADDDLLGWTGTARITSLSMPSPHDGAVTYSVAVTGTGPLTKIP